MCFEVSQQPGVKPFFPGLRLRSPGAGRSGGRREGIAYGYLTEARRLAEQVEEADDRAALLADLKRCGRLIAGRILTKQVLRPANYRARRLARVRNR